MAGRWLTEARATVGLGLPLAAVQTLQFAVGLTVTILVGGLGPEPFAAAALGQSIYFTVWMFANGVTITVAPLVARALGAGRTDDVGPVLRAGLWVGAALAAPAIAIVYQGEALLRALGQDPALAAAAGEFLRVTCFGILPSLWYAALRSFSAALNRPRAVFGATLLGVIANALVASGLLFGQWGLPALGLPGAGWANITAMSVMFTYMAVFVGRHPGFRQYRPFARLFQFDGARMLENLRVGAPVGLTLVLEVAYFNACLQLQGLLGAAQVAAHQAALQLAAVSFMVPLGIGAAATVRVGYFAGAQDGAGAARAGWTALGLGAVFVSISAVLFLAMPVTLISIFIDVEAPENAAVVAIGVTFLMVVAAFQLVDAAQVIMTSALRGMKDTKIPMLIAAFSYWVIGFGASWLLGFHTPLGGLGIWIGSALGLAVAAVLLTHRFVRMTREAAAG